MAKVTKLSILNPADKARMFSVAIGEGTISDAADTIVTNVKDFPIGSQYTDLKGKNFYVRVAGNKTVEDWHKVNA